MADGSAELRRLAQSLQGASDTVRARAAVVNRKTGFDIEADAMVFSPVDTGNLRNSYTVEVANEGLTVSVGPTAAYAPHVELGTTKMAPRPALGPATDRRTPAHLAAMAQVAQELP